MLPKAYDPSATEDSIYKMWEESGAFKADASSNKESFTVSMPPPNATGQLHLGHAVMLALEDIFIRFERMRGKEALWLPGTDHAAIATENVVIRNIQKEEKIKNPRETLGREEVLKRIENFVENSQNTIRSQVRKMGSSCDWSREAYTMELALNRCVNEVFKNMVDDGLIYRGHRTVNWDPNLQTNVSDDEMEYITKKDCFYWFQYGPFQIGTVRPETKFGDKYVVMHPNDKRYKKYKHGDTFECEWINGKITATVIKDEAIDMEFGSGCMTITPWHSHTDFEIAQRHNLTFDQIIDFEGKLLNIAGDFAGMSIEDARPKLIDHLNKKGLVVKIEEEYEHAVAVNSRGKGIIEPQIREQWFIDVNKEVVNWSGKKMSLKQVMQSVIRDGDIRIIPDRFEKIYFHWIDNLRDWCISRQIWWGHRVPVYYCNGCAVVEEEGEENEKGKMKQPSSPGGLWPSRKEKWVVSVEKIDVCPHCGGKVDQDSDTLDTWFSSAMWTWSTLIDKEKALDLNLSLKEILAASPDFQKFHPTSVMETGYDILFFWVARMILMTTYATGQIPFKTVYLHGLVRTRDGKKMSKSDPETCIDPLEIIPKYGADALRLAMIVGQSPGNDFRLYEEKIAGYRNFINKLWNASRFVLMQCEEAGVIPSELQMENGKWKMEDLVLSDKALLSSLQDIIEDVTKGLNDYRLSDVGERLYSFTWDFFCDWYLEISKGEPNCEVLVHTLRTLLILLHPYCPFVTEKLWSEFAPKGADKLINTNWPQADLSLIDKVSSKQFGLVIATISEIRKLRTEQNIEPGKKVDVQIYMGKENDLVSQKSNIERLAKCSLQIVSSKKELNTENAASVFLQGFEIHIPLEGIIDLDKEREKLNKDKKQLLGFLKGIESKLGNDQFMKNAPSDVIEKENAKKTTAQNKLEKIEDRLSSLG